MILEPKKINSVTVSIVSPSIYHEVNGLDAMILVFWMLCFKPTFSLSSFTFIKRLFSSSSLSIAPWATAHSKRVGHNWIHTQALIDDLLDKEICKKSKNTVFFFFQFLKGKLFSEVTYYYLRLNRNNHLPSWKHYWITEKAREFQKNIYFLFIGYAKVFDCVDHNKLWKILKEMGIPDHLTCLLRNLYAYQEATVRTGHGTTDWLQIGEGVH